MSDPTVTGKLQECLDTGSKQIVVRIDTRLCLCLKTAPASIRVRTMAMSPPTQAACIANPAIGQIRFTLAPCLRRTSTTLWWRFSVARHRALPHHEATACKSAPALRRYCTVSAELASAARCSEVQLLSSRCSMLAPLFSKYASRLACSPSHEGKQCGFCHRWVSTLQSGRAVAHESDLDFSNQYFSC